MKLITVTENIEQYDIAMYTGKAREHCYGVYREYDDAQIASFRKQADQYICCVSYKEFEDASRNVYFQRYPLREDNYVINNNKLYGFYIDGKLTVQEGILFTNMSNCTYRHCWDDRGRNYSETVECFLIPTACIDFSFADRDCCQEKSNEYTIIDIARDPSSYTYNVKSALARKEYDSADQLLQYSMNACQARDNMKLIGKHWQTMVELNYYASELMFERKEYIQAINYLKSAIAWCRYNIYITWERACLFINNIGAAFKYLKQYDLAEEFYLFSYKIRKKLYELNSDLYQKIYYSACQGLSALYEMMGDLEKAKLFTDEGNSILPSTKCFSESEKLLIYNELSYLIYKQIFGDTHIYAIACQVRLANARKKYRQEQAQEPCAENFDPAKGITKSIVAVKEIDVSPLMRETLRGLTYKEQLEFFRLTKDWDVTSEAKLNNSMSLMVLESDDVESIIVCDGIVVGVNVKLNDVYFSYTTDSSAEFFNKPSGKVHQLSQRYGGEYYRIYSNAKYTFACILYQ